MKIVGFGSVVAMLAGMALIATPAQAAVNYTGTTYTQSFDDLASAGTSWSNDSTLSGWSLFRRPAPGTAITAITQSNGSSNAGTFSRYSARPKGTRFTPREPWESVGGRCIDFSTSSTCATRRVQKKG